MNVALTLSLNSFGVFAALHLPGCVKKLFSKTSVASSLSLEACIIIADFMAKLCEMVHLQMFVGGQGEAKNTNGLI